MDDLCIHSSKRKDHVRHLKLIFEKCRVYRICLNPKKCVFMVQQGKIIGHIVSKNGIPIDFEKIKVIIELPRPKSAKQVQGFMGHCGYYQRFIYIYAVIVRLALSLIIVFGRIDECEESFSKLKECLTIEPILKSLD